MRSPGRSCRWSGLSCISIVLYLNENDAGSGFYRLAVDLNLLTPKPTADQRLVFWAGQVKATYEYYA